MNSTLGRISPEVSTRRHPNLHDGWHASHRGISFLDIALCAIS